MATGVPAASAGSCPRDGPVGSGGLGVEEVDVPVDKVADEQVAAERAESGRGQRQTPRGVERVAVIARVARGDSLQKVAAGIKDVDEAVPGAPHVVVQGGVLLGVG